MPINLPSEFSLVDPKNVRYTQITFLSIILQYSNMFLTNLSLNFLTQTIKTILCMHIVSDVNMKLISFMIIQNRFQVELVNWITSYIDIL